MNDQVGIIGLGLLGSAIAERLLRENFNLVVFNRTRDKAKPLLELGAQWSDNPLRESRLIIVSLYTSSVVNEVLDQLQTELQPGTIFIDTTTMDPRESCALADRLAQRGATYLDAPVSGSSDQARRGEVISMVGGAKPVVDQCRSLLESYSRATYHLGPTGSGSRIKLISNLVLGLNRAALAEGLGLASASGMDLQSALEVLRDSAAYSKVMDTKGSKMVSGDFTPQARLSQHLKDVRLILEMGSDSHAMLPLTTLHRQLLEDLDNRGYGDLDNCAILKAFRSQQQ